MAIEFRKQCQSYAQGPHEDMSINKSDNAERVLSVLTNRIKPDNRVRG